MELIMIYDQIQCGLGTKDDCMLPLGATRDTVGPAVMMRPYLKETGGHVAAALYCGTGFYLDDPDEVSRKLCAMVQRLSPDLVMCGPAFDFRDYAAMCGRVADDIISRTGIPAIAAMSAENMETIEIYKDRVPIVKMPKKGDGGLNETLKSMCLLARAIVSGRDAEALKETFCY